MPLAIVPRSAIGVPTPPADRTRMSDETWLLAHYTGVETNAATGRYRSADPARVWSDAVAVASFGIASKRPFEYGYLIGLDGRAFEQAGEFMGQHCLDWNAASVGVLFMNAVGVPLTPAQVQTWWQLRDFMVDRELLAPMHDAVPHYRFRATPCCGGMLAEPPGARWQSPTGEGQLGNLVPALLERQPTPPPPPDPLPDDEDDMKPYVLSCPELGAQFVWSPGPEAQPFANPEDATAIMLAEPIAGSQFLTCTVSAATIRAFGFGVSDDD